MQRAVYRCGEQFGVVRNEQQGLVFAAAEGLNDALGACPHHRVKPLERLVQNKQVGILDKGPRQQHQPLLAARQPHEAPVGQSLRTQSRHPRTCCRAQLLRDTAPAPDGIKQPRGNHIHRSHVVGKGAVHLGREVAYMSLYVPDALARAAAAVEERQIESIGTRVVGTYEAQQRTLAAAVAARDVPTLARAHTPVEMFEYRAAAVAYRGVAQLHNPFVQRRGVCSGRQHGLLHRRPLRCLTLFHLHGLRTPHRPRAAHRRHVIHVRDHRRQLRRRAYGHHERHAQMFGHAFHDAAQKLPRRGIKPDEGALEDNSLGRRQQRPRDMVSAQLPARQRNQLAVEQRPHIQKIEQLPAPLLACGRRRRQQPTHRGRHAAVGGVPPLLVIVRRLGRAVGVVEAHRAHSLVWACIRAAE